jgi:hypothetical protein
LGPIGKRKTFSDWDWELISFDADPTFLKRGMMEEEKASFSDRHPEYRYRFNYFGTAFILYGNIKTMTNLLQNVGSGSRMSQSVLGIPGSGMGESQHPDSGSGMNNPNHIF